MIACSPSGIIYRELPGREGQPMAQKVLRFTQDETAAKQEVEYLGGRVVHKLSPTAFVAELPETADSTGLTASTSQPTQPLDEATQLAVTAWAAIADKQARVEAAPPPTEG